MERASTLAAESARNDLVERMQSRQRVLADPAVTVMVVGEFKQGKSSLINALLSAPVCPVDDDVATAVPTVIRYSEKARAAVAGGDGPGDPTWTEVPVDEARRVVLEGGPAVAGQRRVVEIGLPRRLLADGLVLVDTPGVGGIGSVHAAATASALPAADAILFVSDASQELTAPELEFLSATRRLCATSCMVVAKIDLYPEWRAMVEENRAHLERAGSPMEVLAVSSVLRELATQADDRELNAESGFPALVAWLRGLMAGNDDAALRAAVADVTDVARQLEAFYEAQRSTLVDPARADERIEALTRAQEEADRLRSQSAKWQQTLNDLMADLSSDADFDLKTRLREVIRLAEASIDASDPRESWDELEPWLQRRVAAEVLQSHAVVHERTVQVATEVARLFESHESEVLASLPVRSPDQALSSIEVDVSLDAEPMSIGDAGLSVLRGSYGGFLMFGMLGSLAGMALANPASIFMGLLMGRRALRDERARQLAQARQQAKAACRRYVDEVGFVMGKESRDSIRRAQRHLRDHFGARAEAVHRSASECLAAVQKARRADESERRELLSRVETGLARTRSVAEGARRLAP